MEQTLFFHVKDVLVVATNEGTGTAALRWMVAKTACVSLEGLSAKVHFLFGSGSPLWWGRSMLSAACNRVGAVSD